MPDIPANVSTPARVVLGGSYSDVLEIEGDLDWIGVSLTAGTWVEIALTGSGPTPIFDPYLQFFSPTGTFIDANDDDVGTYDSLITFQVLNSGTYFIEAGTFGGDERGGYTVSVRSVAPPPPLNLLDTINWGQALASSAVSVYFAPSGQSFGGYTSTGFNAYEISRFQAAFDLIEAVSGLTFNIVNSAASAVFRIVLALDTFGDEPLGFFNPPGETDQGIGVFFQSTDFWDRAVGGDLDAGGYSMVTIVHELLHGLGLAHPHDNGGTSTIMGGVGSPFDDLGDYSLNQGVFTTMSYNTGYIVGASGSERDAGDRFGSEYGPMALDIALLQQLYGANNSANTGNTVYTLPTTNAPGTFWRAIWDTSGSDEIRHTGAANSIIDLRAATLDSNVGGGGYVTSVTGIAGGFTIANGVVIENASGGSGRDIITGNASANILLGNNGNDELYGGAGNDTLRGGAGADRLDGGTGNDVMEGGLGNDFYFVGSPGDVIQGEVGFAAGGGIDTVRVYINNYVQPTNVEIVRIGSLTDTTNFGATGNDAPGTLVGNAGNNSLNGRGGNDQINGNAGNDTLIGGEGADTLVGGSGADRFVFSSVSNSRVGAANRDFINGFDRGQDRIDLSAIDANTTTFGTNDAFSFIGTSGFSGVAGQLRVQVLGGPNACIVEMDVNGDRVADMQIFVNLQSTMVAGDFIL